jgi:acetolactate synthase-1/2/3 large subunit
MASMTGAEALVASLAGEGVEVIFGIPGVQVMDVIDAIYHYKGIRWITTRHEQAAAYMAMGYARTTGKEGVALVVPGPGALNTTAAIGTAYAASIPVLLISGQNESYTFDQNRGYLHQINSQLEVFRPLTKWCHRVAKRIEIQEAVQEAIYQLRTGRPRPVELEITSDVWTTSGETVLLERKSTSAEPPDQKLIKEAAHLLLSANRPLIWAGGGIITSNASGELTHLAENLNAPVVTTNEGKGAINETHPLALGGTHFGINPVSLQADVILITGSSFHRVGNPWKPQQNQRIIQIDIDREEIGRNLPVHIGIAADARQALNAILDELPEENNSRWQKNDLDGMRAKVRAKWEEVAPLQLSIIEVIREELKDGILVPGVNNIGYWCQLAYPVYQPRTYITPSYFVTLGYALPTALGAKIGNPDKPVIAICGDGGFLFAEAELATAVQEGINIVVLLFTDDALGSCLRIQQKRFNGRILGTCLRNPDFVALAKSFGASGILLGHANELRDALRSALAEDRPVVIQVPVPTMIPPWEISI